MALQIVNPDPKYSTVHLVPPATLGYLHLGAEVSPPRRPGPVLLRSRDKVELIGGLKVLAGQLEKLPPVEKVTVYDAIVFAPPVVTSDGGRTGFDRPASTWWCWSRPPHPRLPARCGPRRSIRLSKTC
jgi:hypothetical protein